MISGIVGWVIGKAMALAGSKVVQTTIDIYNRSQNSAVRLAEINAETGQAIYDTATRHAAAQQATKMNWSVFWVLIVVMVGAPAFLLWGITLYNVFWHANGIWPQNWDIAAYPPSVAPWVQMSIEWLYNPVGVPGTVASAWLAGRVTGK